MEGERERNGNNNGEEVSGVLIIKPSGVFRHHLLEKQEKLLTYICLDREQ